MKMKRIREWKFREVLVEKGRKNGMKMMMNSEGFYRPVWAKSRHAKMQGAARFCVATVNNGQIL